MDIGKIIENFWELEIVKKDNFKLWLVFLAQPVRGCWSFELNKCCKKCDEPLETRYIYLKKDEITLERLIKAFEVIKNKEARYLYKCSCMN